MTAGTGRRPAVFEEHVILFLVFEHRRSGACLRFLYFHRGAGEGCWLAEFTEEQRRTICQRPEVLEMNSRASALAEKTGNLPELVHQLGMGATYANSIGDYFSAAALADEALGIAERGGGPLSLTVTHCRPRWTRSDPPSRVPACSAELVSQSLGRSALRGDATVPE